MQAQRLIAALRAEGLRVALLPFPPDPKSALGRLARRIGGLRTISNVLWLLTRIPRTMRHTDVLHLFGTAGTAFWWAPFPLLFASKATRTPTVLHWHDGRIEGQLDRHPWTNWGIGLASKLVAPSGYLVDVFRRHDLESQTIVNTVDPDRFRYRERREIRPRFLHNRGFEDLYNVPCTLRAFARVQKKYPEASLALPHDGPLRGELEELAADLGLRNVDFLGPVAPDDMAELYDQADIYWMSPNVDNMPLSALECFASGLPIISTRAGGVPYIVEDGRTGLLVDLDDHQAMAQAAFRLLEEDGLATRLAENGRAELARYEPQAVAKEWIALYESQIRMPTRHKM